MFGWMRKPQSAQAVAQANEQFVDEQLTRIHNETLGHVWHALSGMDPAKLIPNVVQTVAHTGGTRPAWQWEHQGREYIAMASPPDCPLRLCVLFCAEKGKQLKPISIFPLLEGLPNDFAVAEAVPQSQGGGANVAVQVIRDEDPLWFFDPFYVRDQLDLTPDVTQSFLLGAVALGVRPAPTDEVSVTSGPEYEKHAREWRAAHPGAETVPPLKVDPVGRRYIMPGHFFGEYQVRCPISKIDEYKLQEMPLRVLYLSFPLIGREPIVLPVYASQFTLGTFSPAVGEDVEAYLWLQGRVVDMPATQPTAQ